MTFRRATLVKSAISSRVARSKRRASFPSQPREFEVLEGRQLLAIFSVMNLNPSGAGSLRQAIIQSNHAKASFQNNLMDENHGTPSFLGEATENSSSYFGTAPKGADTIDFGVAGTIHVGRAGLPSITSPLTIDGSSAPTFAGSPVVTIDFHGSKGFNFAKGSNGSTLSSLSVVNASNAGVTINSSDVTVEGNDIGLLANGSTIAGNRGDGVQINASSHNDLIGHSDPVTGTTYYNADSANSQAVSAWQGIRPSATSGQYLIVGTSGTNGLLYDGPISGSGGTSDNVDYPGATSTSVYGPDVLPDGGVRLVGSYKNGNGVVNGFVFQGSTSDLSVSGDYQTIDYPGATYTYVHSTMGDLAVGNADGPEGNAPLGTGHAFLYDVAQNKLLPDIVYPGSTTTTAYGIWYNGGASYTIAGGYSDAQSSSPSAGKGYLVDYNSATGQYSNWTSFAYPNGLVGQDFETHFEGISSTEAGVYTLVADSVQTGSTNPTQGSWVTVRRNPDGSFGAGVWVNLNYPGVDPTTAITSANAVAGNQVVGVVISGSSTISYQATINTGFQLSNVISGNGGNGIGIYGSDDNQIAMNEIGTDASGTIRLGNAKNGILVTNRAKGNLIGGQATGGNDPTNSVFVRPPQGNLISGNSGDGVLINNGSTQTLLSGNYVGTSASGNTSLGNKLDGVAIENANGNQLIGCTLRQDPFVFYNVLSGNGGDGLRIENSNNTTVQANFMGVGANNASIVANGGDGLLVSGSSKNTQVGGVIPLGNVISGNNGNGIEVSGQASGFTSFNTFAGIYAFGLAAPNKLDGILVTSTGGNNQIRTSIVSGNLDNGIELGGNASGVQVTDTAVGTNTSIGSAIPNQGDGILISGNAHGNDIGGFQPSVEPQVTVSSNLGYGIAIVGTAHDNIVYHSYVGTNYNDTIALGNDLGGILLGPGTSSNTIGGASALLADKILNSVGSGVIIQSSSGNSVLGDDIQGNAGSGVVVIGGRKNLIGSANAGNTITENGQDGVEITGISMCTSVQANEIDSNTGNGVLLATAQRVTIGGSTPGSGNQIVSNLGYGLEAIGTSTASVVQGNVIEANAEGNVNLSKASGIVYSS
jgi:trimeric autotransporter adhesin